MAWLERQLVQEDRTNDVMGMATLMSANPELNTDKAITWHTKARNDVMALRLPYLAKPDTISKPRDFDVAKVREQLARAEEARQNRIKLKDGRA